MRNEWNCQRHWRRIALGGMALLLAAAAIMSAPSASPAVAVQTSPETSPACRTMIRGDQTQLNLYDLSQFVPVSSLSDTAEGADTPDPSGTPVAASELMATPAPEIEQATPEPNAIASPEASPIAESVAVIVSDDDQLRSVVFGVLNCTSQHDFDTLAELVTNTYLRNTFGGGANLNREDLLLIAAVTVIPGLQLVAFDNVQVNGDRATAEVLSRAGNQLRHDSWSFVRSAATNQWKVQQVTPLFPLAVEGSATVDVEIDENGMTTDPREVSGGNVVLLGSNSDSVDHEMLVLRLPTGSTTDILLQTGGPDLPAGVAFIGQMTVPAGGKAVLPLMDLAPGNYVIVDMLLDDQGLPNFASGYRARLIVGE